MPIQPYIPDSGVLKFEILVPDKNEGLDSLLMDAEVHFELNKIPSAKFRFTASNQDINNGEKLASDTLKEKDEITFNIFSGNTKKTLFKGIIKSVEKVQTENQIYTKIECKDKTFGMTFPAAAAEINDQTFDDKLGLLAKNIQVDASLTGKEWGKEKITHNSSTLPWDFVLAYFDSIGIAIAAKNGELKGVDILEAGTEKYFAENGINVFSFSGKSDDSKKLKKATIEYWDPGSQSMQKSEAEQDAVNPNIKTISLNENRFSQGTIKRMVDTLLKKSDLRTIQGKVLTFGNLQAGVGDYMMCNKVNSKIDNKLLFITAEHHIIENANWKTEYTFGLEAESTFAESTGKQVGNPQAQIGQTNAISGLLIGIVLKIEEDPLNEFRIKVRIPALSANGDGIWARLATLNASTEMGSFFIPNVNDEVILGCLGNNPDTPVILGSVYSSAIKPPFPIAKENYIKGFVTKEGTKIVLDDEKKVIELSTKKGNKLLITDDQKGFILEDENKNKIIMNQDGITIESSKDLIMKAKGNIQMESAAAKMKASGNMELKGSMIKLN